MVIFDLWFSPHLQCLWLVPFISNLMLLLPAYYHNPSNNPEHLSTSAMHFSTIYDPSLSYLFPYSTMKSSKLVFYFLGITCCLAKAVPKLLLGREFTPPHMLLNPGKRGNSFGPDQTRIITTSPFLSVHTLGLPLSFRYNTAQGENRGSL